ETLKHDAFVTSAAWAPREPDDPPAMLALTGSMDQTVRLWMIHPDGRSQVLRILRHAASVTAVAINPKTGVILAGGDDATRWRWPPLSSARAEVLRRHHGPVTDVSFSPDGKLALTAGLDGTVAVWGQPEGRQPRASLPHPGLRWLAFSPDGKRLLTAGSDRTA